MSRETTAMYQKPITTGDSIPTRSN